MRAARTISEREPRWGRKRRQVSVRQTAPPRTLRPLICKGKPENQSLTMPKRSVSVTLGTPQTDMFTGLIGRNGRYSTRRVIPLDLQAYFGRREIVRALGARFSEEAKSCIDACGGRLNDRARMARSCPPHRTVSSPGVRYGRRRADSTNGAVSCHPQGCDRRANWRGPARERRRPGREIPSRRRVEGERR
jgi:hypothetical protein